MRRERARVVARTIAILVSLQAIAIGLYLSVDRGRRPSPPGTGGARALASRPAPPLEIERPGGAIESLAGLRGRVVIVHFWATWCPPCRRELPVLLSLAAELRRAGRVELLAVSVDDDWTTLNTYFDGEIPAEVVRATTKDVHLQYGASTLPDSYLVDRDGNLVQRFAGAQDWRDPQLRAVLEDLLRDPGRTPATTSH
jgi:thiol-disulfide isomerase/thioredoxin